MKVNAYIVKGSNTGILIKTDELIDLKKRRWIDSKGTSHPMKFLIPIAFKNKNVYFLHLFGDDRKEPHHGVHISLTFLENQRFLFMQKSHWLQKEENIRYIINILFLIGGLTIGILNLIKSK